MQDKLQALKDHMARYVDITAAAGVLNWDQEVNMPPGGAAIRSDQISTLRGMAHQIRTDPKVGELLEDLVPYGETLDYDSDDAALIRKVARDYNKVTRLSTDLVMAIAKTSGLAKEAWKEARARKDFSIFAPLLEEMVGLQIEKANCYATGGMDNLYDALLDDFEPGLDYAYINGVFSDLKERLVPLIQAIAENQDAVDSSVRQRHVPAEKQLAFGEMVARQIGYDFHRGRMDLAVHPFTSGYGRDDVRITTRVLEHDNLSCLMAVIHEAGHGMHGQNYAPELYRTPLSGSTMAIAESQSRFFENVIGRSRAFWNHFYPKLQEAWSPALDDVSEEDWYKAVNESKPSLIRVEADEVTYGMHIMVRFEIENDLINGRIRVADLPGIWNAKMEAYLGIVPPDDAVGVLQDIHWSQGGFGYFPDYLLGSIFAAQLWDKMQVDNPGTLLEVAEGEFGNVLSWTRDHVMAHGAKYTFPELAERIVGGFSADAYVAYLTAKMGEVYGIQA